MGCGQVSNATGQPRRRRRRVLTDLKSVAGKRRKRLASRTCTCTTSGTPATPSPAETGAALRELMDRMGQGSTRAVLVYLHSREERGKDMAAGMDAMVKKARK
jgi:hypothetical protein